MTQEQLLEEARRRYPIGTLYKPAHIDQTDAPWYEVVSGNDFENSDSYLWCWSSDRGYSNWQPVVWHQGKWAEIKEKSTKEEYCTQNEVFPKDSYIVLLAGCDGTDTWPESIPINYCYKLSRESYLDYRGFSIYKDLVGTRGNGWSTTNDYNSKLQMRFATREEIAEYNRLGKPYDVTAYDEWEPLKETCKKCANLYYNGYVNTGSHNLCEGSHCQDMREDEVDYFSTAVLSNLDKDKVYYVENQKVYEKLRAVYGCAGLGVIDVDDWHYFEWHTPHENWCLQRYDQVKNKKIYNLNGTSHYKGSNLLCKPTIETVYNPILDEPLRAVYSEPLEVFIPKENVEVKSFQSITLKTINKLKL